MALSILAGPDEFALSPLLEEMKTVLEYLVSQDSQGQFFKNGAKSMVYTKYHFTSVLDEVQDHTYLCMSREYYGTPLNYAGGANSNYETIFQLFTDGEHTGEWTDPVFSLEKSLDTVPLATQARLLADYNDDTCLTFIIGVLENGYYRIFGLEGIDDGGLFITAQMLQLNQTDQSRLFVIPGRIQPSLWSRIVAINVPQVYYIGGNHAAAWPLMELVGAVKQLPQRHEISKYINAESSLRLQNFVTSKRNYPAILNETQTRRLQSATAGQSPEPVVESAFQGAQHAISTLRDVIQQHLDADDWIESQWQQQLEFVFPFLYPEYIASLREKELPVDHNSAKKNDRPDFVMLRDTGSVDIIEIKRPSFQIMRDSLYRGNFHWSFELEGQLAQSEKYLYNLNRWGMSGENRFTKLFSEKLGSPTKVYIRSPKALLIIGRTDQLAEEQLRDYDILRTKYQDILDIISYDELLKRMDMILKRNFPHAE